MELSHLQTKLLLSVLPDEGVVLGVFFGNLFLFSLLFVVGLEKQDDLFLGNNLELLLDFDETEKVVDDVLLLVELKELNADHYEEGDEEHPPKGKQNGEGVAQKRLRLNVSVADC